VYQSHDFDRSVQAVNDLNLPQLTQEFRIVRNTVERVSTEKQRLVPASHHNVSQKSI